MTRRLYHDAMHHKGGPAFCLECRSVTDPDEEARVSLTARGWAASSDGVCHFCGAPTDPGVWCICPQAIEQRLENGTTRYTPPVHTDDGVEQHAFSLAAAPVLQRALDLVTERGGTHGDTWALPMVTTFLHHVLALKGIVIDDPEWERLLCCAVFIDMKDARFARGEWKDDDLADGVNYRSVFATWRAEYDHEDTTDAILDQHRGTRTAG